MNYHLCFLGPMMMEISLLSGILLITYLIDKEFERKKNGMKVRLLRKIRKECEKGMVLVRLPKGKFCVFQKGTAYFCYGITKEQAIQCYRSHVYYIMEKKVQKLRKKKNYQRRVKFSLWD